MRKLLFPFVLSVLTLPSLARAGAEGVGLGVAAGMAYSSSHPELADKDDVIGARFAWGFFVDIPLLSTFYITPSTMLYELDAFGDGTHKTPITDVDLNFKFIVPMHSVSFGAGLTSGLTVGLEDHYVGHWGLLGQVGFNLVSNLDAFVLAQYKHLMPEDRDDITDVHVYAGGMYHF
jgi:hypothetical protein